jgi:pSer/pThr/pTyr-binding forkhead associated (FHA) protein
MGASTADTPATPEFLRASDAERDQAVSELRNEFVEGRLSHDTFMYRMHTALGARNRGQLARLFTDLPPRRSGSRRLLARVRAALTGDADPEGTGRDLAIPPTPRITVGRPGPHEAARPQPDQAGPAPGPAPLVFPPGSGVRFTIGRTRACDLCLTDLSVSRTHALLVRREDGWVLSDLGSHNGTRLNGWLVREPVQVRAGDRVEFGSMAFIIQGDPPPPSSEEEPGLTGTGP